MGVLSPPQDDHDRRKMRSTSRSIITFKWQIFFAICSLGLALFMALRRRPSLLPPAYALCSRQGNNVYIVNESNARVQCIVVEDASIVFVGSLGRFLEFRIHNNDAISIETVKAQWFESRSENLEIRTIPHGSIVVPGLSGKYTSFHYFNVAHHHSRFPCPHPRIWRRPTATPGRCKNNSR